MRRVKSQRHPTSFVSTGRAVGPQNNGIGLHLPVTDCRGFPVAKRGVSVVTRSFSM
jgi:hypothetical protein